MNPSVLNRASNIFTAIPNSYDMPPLTEINNVIKPFQVKSTGHSGTAKKAASASNSGPRQ